MQTPSMMHFHFMSGNISNLSKKLELKIEFEVSAIRNFNVNLFARPVDIEQVRAPYVFILVPFAASS